MHQMPTPLTHHASPTGFPIGAASSSFGAKTPLMTRPADVHPRRQAKAAHPIRISFRDADVTRPIVRDVRQVID